MIAAKENPRNVFLPLIFIDAPHATSIIYPREPREFMYISRSFSFLQASGVITMFDAKSVADDVGMRRN